MEKIVALSLFVTLLSALSVSAAAPAHHLYVGMFVGGDSVNAAAGGWDNNDANSLDREMVAWGGNKNFAVEQTFQAYDYSPQNIDGLTTGELERIWHAGRVPMVNLLENEVMTCTGKTMVTLAGDLANPSSQSTLNLRKWAKGLKDWLAYGPKRFLLLAFFQEANYSICFNESIPSTRDYVDPDAFKSVFRSARGIVESEIGSANASRVHWIFGPAFGSNNGMPGFEAYYPGDDIVDWIGLSAYNWGGLQRWGMTAAWQGFDEMVKPYLDRLKILSPSKPLALLQTASISFGGDKAAWLQDFYAKASRYPGLYLVVYFNVVHPGEAGLAAGFDYPIYWRALYDARPDGYNVFFPPGLMKWDVWRTRIITDPSLVFSSVAMPPAGTYTVYPPVNHDLLPELRDRNGDRDGDGVPNWKEFEAGLDPFVSDVQATETNCRDGIDNDANGRTDGDDTVACGEIPIAEGAVRKDTIRSGEYRFFRFDVPAGSGRVHIDAFNLTANVDLYVSFGLRPSLQAFFAKSSSTGTVNEHIGLEVPAPGTWYLLVHGKGGGTYEVTIHNHYDITPMVSALGEITVCDFDGNGKDDIVYSVNGSGVQAYANDGSWLDLLTNSPPPTSLGCGDIDGDGIPDLVGSWTATGTIKYFDRASWSWVLMGSSLAPDALIVKDLDGNGTAEIIGVFRDAGFMKVREETGVWNNIPTSGIGLPNEIFVGDMTGDRIPEIIGLWRTQAKIRYYSDGVWTDIPLPAGFTKAPDIMKLANVDNDAYADIVAIWRTDPYSMQVMTGHDRVWSEILHRSHPNSIPSRIAVVDVDGDLKDDIVCLWDILNQMQVFLQRWHGFMIFYDAIRPAMPSGIAVGNFDGDTSNRGDLALIWPDAMKVWMNSQFYVDVPVTPIFNFSRFTDVPVAYWAYPFVERLFNSGVTAGCTADNLATPQNEAAYCPESPVTRSQMAVFVVRALGQQPSATCTGVFQDVTASTVGVPLCTYIEKLAALGITGGCGSGNYCPNDPVNRGQMAAFITRALGQQPSATCAGVFQDVSAGTVGVPFCTYIEKLAALGITAGCGGGNYCPFNAVTRAQMAVFLTRAFGL